MYKAFLIKYGEIGVKGKNRFIFEDALVRQIKFSLKDVEGEFDVRRADGRIYVNALSDYDYDEVIESLTRVFGIVGICPVVQIEDNGFDDLANQVINYLDKAYKNKNLTFKVNARRTRKNYPMNSMEINMELGGRILDAFPEMKVDVHKPEVLLQVEIRGDVINIYSIEVPGPGGMPIGTAGKAMLLLSGGIDSPVAGYMVAKRGVQIEATYFHAPPYTSERAKKKMSEYITTYTGKHFKPTEPDPELFDIADIAHALSLICRGNGHVKTFWSVGEHCICCAKEAKARGLSDRMVLACLLHDASECYMSDVPSPFKKELPEYNEREERMLSMIYEKFLGSDLTPEEKMQLNAIDKAMLWYDLTFLLGEKLESEAPELHIDLRYEVRAFGEVEEEYRRIFEEQLITVQNKRI